MLTAQQTGVVFSIPSDFDFQKLSGSRFGVHWGKEDICVEILFSNRVADYVKERTWHPSQHITEHENGKLTLQLTVNHLLELKRWILSWGSEATVLSPKNFANDIRQTLLDAASNYSK
jgi:proteasome accessory factor B